MKNDYDNIQKLKKALKLRILKYRVLLAINLLLFL